MTASATRSLGLIRRAALTTAVAGIAALGVLSASPAAAGASADGPDYFRVLDHGRVPVFFCDDENPNKQHNNCVDVSGDTRF